MLLDRLSRLVGRALAFVGGALELTHRLVEVLAQLGDLIDQAGQLGLLRLRFLEGLLRLSVRSLDLIDRPARLRHGDLRALSDGGVALLDRLLQRSLQLLAGLVHLSVLLLHRLERRLRLLLGLVLLPVVLLLQLVVLRRRLGVLLVRLPHRIALGLLGRRVGAIAHLAGRVGPRRDVGEHLGARLPRLALELRPELVQLPLAVGERLLHQLLHLLLRLVGAVRLALFQVPGLVRCLQRLLQDLPGALQHFLLELVQDAIHRLLHLLLHLLRDPVQLLLRLVPYLGEELLRFGLVLLRLGKPVLSQLLDGGLDFFVELLRLLQRGLRLIDHRLSRRGPALRHLRLQLLELRHRLVAGRFALRDHLLGLYERLFRLLPGALQGVVGDLLGLLDQLVQPLDRRLDLGLGGVDDFPDLLGGRVTGLL